jgi:hypothetical protein
MLVICPCEECGARLEFDPAEMQGNEVTVQCPKCNKETRLYVSRVAASKAVAEAALRRFQKPAAAYNKRSIGWQIGGIVIGLGFLLLALITFSDAATGMAQDLKGVDETIFQQIYRSSMVSYHEMEFGASILSAGIGFILIFLSRILSKL